MPDEPTLHDQNLMSLQATAAALGSGNEEVLDNFLRLGGGSDRLIRQVLTRVAEGRSQIPSAFDADTLRSRIGKFEEWSQDRNQVLDFAKQHKLPANQMLSQYGHRTISEQRRFERQQADDPGALWDQGRRLAAVGAAGQQLVAGVSEGGHSVIAAGLSALHAPFSDDTWAELYQRRMEPILDTIGEVFAEQPTTVRGGIARGVGRELPFIVPGAAGGRLAARGMVRAFGSDITRTLAGRGVPAFAAVASQGVFRLPDRINQYVGQGMTNDEAFIEAIKQTGIDAGISSVTASLGMDTMARWMSGTGSTGPRTARAVLSRAGFKVVSEVTEELAQTLSQNTRFIMRERAQEGLPISVVEAMQVAAADERFRDDYLISAGVATVLPLVSQGAGSMVQRAQAARAKRRVEQAANQAAQTGEMSQTQAQQEIKEAGDHAVSERVIERGTQDAAPETMPEGAVSPLQTPAKPATPESLTQTAQRLAETAIAQAPESLRQVKVETAKRPFRGRRSGTVALGKYNSDANTITLHPALANAPEAVQEFVLAHEMLHAAQNLLGLPITHTPEFQNAESNLPNREAATRWINENLDHFAEGAQGARIDHETRQVQLDVRPITAADPAAREVQEQRRVEMIEGKLDTPTVDLTTDALAQETLARLTNPKQIDGFVRQMENKVRAKQSPSPSELEVLKALTRPTQAEQAAILKPAKQRTESDTTLVEKHAKRAARIDDAVLRAGTIWSEAGRALQDPQMSPSERAAMMLNRIDPEVRARLQKRADDTNTAFLEVQKQYEAAVETRINQMVKSMKWKELQIGPDAHPVAQLVSMNIIENAMGVTPDGQFRYPAHLLNMTIINNSLSVMSLAGSVASAATIGILGVPTDLLHTAVNRGWHLISERILHRNPAEGRFFQHKRRWMSTVEKMTGLTLGLSQILPNMGMAWRTGVSATNMALQATVDPELVQTDIMQAMTRHPNSAHKVFPSQLLTDRAGRIATGFMQSLNSMVDEGLVTIADHAIRKPETIQRAIELGHRPSTPEFDAFVAREMNPLTRTDHIISDRIATTLQRVTAKAAPDAAYSPIGSLVKSLDTLRMWRLPGSTLRPIQAFFGFFRTMTNLLAHSYRITAPTSVVALLNDVVTVRNAEKSLAQAEKPAAIAAAKRIRDQRLERLERQFINTAMGLVALAGVLMVMDEEELEAMRKGHIPWSRMDISWLGPLAGIVNITGSMASLLKGNINIADFGGDVIKGITNLPFIGNRYSSGGRDPEQAILKNMADHSARSLIPLNNLVTSMRRAVDPRYFRRGITPFGDRGTVVDIFGTDTRRAQGIIPSALETGGVRVLPQTREQLRWADRLTRTEGVSTTPFRPPRDLDLTPDQERLYAVTAGEDFWRRLRASGINPARELTTREISAIRRMRTQANNRARRTVRAR